MQIESLQAFPNAKEKALMLRIENSVCEKKKVVLLFSFEKFSQRKTEMT